MKSGTVRAPAFLVCGLISMATLAPRPAAADISINVEKLSTDGMEVRKLTCKLASGGLFGAMVIVAELAKHKSAFDKCAEAGAAFQTEFTWKDGKTTNAKVTGSSDANADACVVATLKKTKAAVAGTCTAILLTGKTAKAEAAAAALEKKE